jgi:hypothetical protein
MSTPLSMQRVANRWRKVMVRKPRHALHLGKSPVHCSLALLNPNNASRWQNISRFDTFQKRPHFGDHRHPTVFAVFRAVFGMAPDVDTPAHKITIGPSHSQASPMRKPPYARKRTRFADAMHHPSPRALHFFQPCRELILTREPQLFRLWASALNVAGWIVIPRPKFRCYIQDGAQYGGGVVVGRRRAINREVGCPFKALPLSDLPHVHCLKLRP